MRKKIILIIIIAISITYDINAQKILFDNTKSEQAGNADWVIDTDSRIPSPAQSGITGNPFPNPTGDVDTYWSGALSMWGIEMVKHGYIVETLPGSGSITYGDEGNPQDLSNYAVFVVCEPNNPFSSAEKTAILTFVQNGGGLFMIADHNIADRDGDGWSADEVWNDLMAGDPFGMTFSTTDDFTNAPSTNMANLPGDPLLHGIAGDVDGIEFHGGTSLSINTANNPTVIAVAYKTGATNPGTSGIMCAYATYGSGRVVGLGDSSAAEDNTSNDGTTYPGWIQPIGGIVDMDNGRLATNATLWLAESSSSDIENLQKNIVEIYPNPADKFVNLSSKTNIREIKILNLIGKMVFSEKLNSKYLRLDIRNYKKGIYFVEITAESGKQLLKLIVR